MTMLVPRRARSFDRLRLFLGVHVRGSLFHSSLSAWLLCNEHVRIRPGSLVYAKGACVYLLPRATPKSAANESCYSTESQVKYRRVPVLTESIRSDGKPVNHQASGNRPPRPAAETRLR